MRSPLFFVACLITGFFTACNQPPAYEGEEIVIEHVTVIPMTGEEVLEDQTVVIREGKIFKLGAHEASPNAELIDGTGKFLMPGLTEMHAHIPVAEAGNDTLVKETLFLYLSQGITTIRGMFGNAQQIDRVVVRGKILNKEFIEDQLREISQRYKTK